MVNWVDLTFGVYSEVLNTSRHPSCVETCLQTFTVLYETSESGDERLWCLYTGVTQLAQRSRPASLPSLLLIWIGFLAIIVSQPYKTLS